MKNKDIRRSISIRAVLLIAFVVAMVISIGSISYYLYRTWLSSTKQTAERMAAEINGHIYNRIYSFLHLPEQINDFNHKIIANGILDLSDENLRDKYFVGVLSSYEDEIYSFCYGNENGEYYGARRNEHGEMQIIRNNAATGGHSWYYAVNDDLTAGELIMQEGSYDPRTRTWYKVAVEEGGPFFSPVYKHFIMDDLVITYACPIYSEDGALQGVLGTHILLSGIGSYLKDTVSQYNGYAVIVERSTNKLIANSMGEDNFTVLDGGTLDRHDIGALTNPDIVAAYNQYTKNPVPDFSYEGSGRGLYINAGEIPIPGLDWVVITAIPEEYLATTAGQSIHIPAMLSVALLILSFLAYTVLTGQLLKPMRILMQATDAFSSGDLTKRVNIRRNDEIGHISLSFNKVANELQALVDHLEDTVKERTEELEKTVLSLDESKSQLQLILDSTAEAIYGIDTHGNCTFCNMSCLKMLGYSSQSELLGKNMHSQLHNRRRDGTPLPAEECKICRTFSQGKKTHMDDAVFWRADGSSIEVECYSYPQVKNGEIIGAVVTFWDISDRKQKEAEIQYLSCHDILTGLFNRRCFDEKWDTFDSPENLPLSVIFADINGLKMTNDIFGHTAGDNLIKKSAEILKQVCRKNDIVARVGGDEFIILLPNTTRETAGEILDKIKALVADARVEAVKCSIALGLDTKLSPEQRLDEIMANAENEMYKDKTLNRRSVNRDIVNTIIDTLHAKSPREKQHSIAVRELCSELGAALNLPETEINKLKRTAYLHNIGKIVLDEDILAKTVLSDEEYEKMQQHSAVGYRY